MQLHWNGCGDTQCEVTSCLWDNNRVDTKIPIQHLPTWHTHTKLHSINILELDTCLKGITLLCSVYGYITDTKNIKNLKMVHFYSDQFVIKKMSAST
jgi:hypothetical protein